MNIAALAVITAVREILPCTPYVAMPIIDGTPTQTCYALTAEQIAQSQSLMEQSLSDVVGHSGLIALATYAIMVALVPQHLFTVMVMGTGLMDMRPAVVLINRQQAPPIAVQVGYLMVKFRTAVSGHLVLFAIFSVTLVVTVMTTATH